MKGGPLVSTARRSNHRPGGAPALESGSYSYGGDPNFTGANGTGTLNVTDGVQVLSDLSKAHQAGSTVPFQIELTNAAGQNITTANLVVTAVNLAPASNPNDLLPVQAPGNSDPTNVFAFRNGEDQYNLKTPKDLAAGSYLLYFTVAGDPVTHSLTFQVKS